MKIVYLIEDFSVKGGAERIVAEKASLLAGRCGHDVTIVSVFRDDRPQSYPLGPGVSLERLDVPFPERSRGPVLKAAGLLTRDPRMKERKKYGLKAARRAPQFSKR